MNLFYQKETRTCQTVYSLAQTELPFPDQKVDIQHFWQSIYIFIICFLWIFIMCKCIMELKWPLFPCYLAKTIFVVYVGKTGLSIGGCCIVHLLVLLVCICKTVVFGVISTVINDVNILMYSLLMVLHNRKWNKYYLWT